MLYPYAKFLLEFDRRHGQLTHRNSPANTKAAVLIEGRPLYFLPMVLKNTMFFLGSTWNLHVIYSEFAEPYLEERLKDWDVNGVKLQGLTRLSRPERDSLMKSSEFWKIFPEEKLLVFESNSVTCGSNIDAFLDYDFIGAPMGSAESFSLNGGFSLRSRRKLIESIVTGRDNGEPEDEFFTRMMRQIGARTPDFGSACRFAVASDYEGHPVGVPATDEGLHSAEIAEKIVGRIEY
ncbi:MAG TPA: DUF5672 family protein [Polyangiaceae bacterium]|jgi:hypothetical protein|nr:DUF5672 family protein [Polyangiaceae bacterium]